MTENVTVPDIMFLVWQTLKRALIMYTQFTDEDFGKFVAKLTEVSQFKLTTSLTLTHPHPLKPYP